MPLASEINPIPGNAMKARTFTDSFSIIKKLTLLLHLITFVVFYGNGQRRNPVDIISNPTAWHPHYCRRLRCIGLSWRRNSKSIENTFGFLFFLCCLFVLHQVEARNWSGSSRFSPPVMFDRIGRVHRAGRRARVESNPQKKKKKLTADEVSMSAVLTAHYGSEPHLRWFIGGERRRSLVIRLSAHRS